MKEHLPYLQKELGYEHTFFTPMCYRDEDGQTWVFGHAIMTNHPVKLLEKNYYYHLEEDPGIIPIFDSSPELIPKTVNRALTVVEVLIDGVTYVVGNTHFTWTPDGLPNAWQEQDLPRLIEVSSKYPNLIMCGDFNAPRGRNPIWDILSEHFKDNIPAHIESTLDPLYHRAPEILRAVDGIFTTPGYVASNVNVRCGISDHCAVIADVQKTA